MCRWHVLQGECPAPHQILRSQTTSAQNLASSQKGKDRFQVASTHSRVTVTERSPLGLQTTAAPVFRCYGHRRAPFHGLRLSCPASHHLPKPAALSCRSWENCFQGSSGSPAQLQDLFTEDIYSNREPLLRAPRETGAGRGHRAMGAQNPQANLLEYGCSPACPLWAWMSGPGVRVAEAGWCELFPP